MSLQRHLKPRFNYPVLGAISRSRGSDWWAATVDVGEHMVEFRFAGLMEPNRFLVQHAHDLLATWPSFERILQSFLVVESTRWPLLRKEVLKLQLEAVGLFWPHHPGHATLFFRGTRPFRFWICSYEDGLPVRLQVDTQRVIAPVSYLPEDGSRVNLQ